MYDQNKVIKNNNMPTLFCLYLDHLKNDRFLNTKNGYQNGANSHQIYALKLIYVSK